MSVKPITPAGAAKPTFPDAVVETWNTAITENLRNGCATIKQEEIVTRLSSAMEVSRREVFQNGWLYIENLYRSAGWTVKYERPGFGELYDAFFEFSERR